MKKFKGVTVIEVIVSLAIVGVLAAILVGDYSQYKEDTAKYNHGFCAGCGGNWKCIEVRGDSTMLYRCNECGEVFTTQFKLK